MRYLLAGIAFAIALGISSARPQTAGERGDWCRWAAEQAVAYLTIADSGALVRSPTSAALASSYIQIFSTLGCDPVILIQELEKRKVRR
jgi:hypothetical protein